MYNDIGRQLAQQGVHALALDFRGFGQSISDDFDVSKIAKLSKTEGDKMWLNITSHWPSDVQQAYRFLQKKANSTNFVGVIGASCGGYEVINLAEKNNIAVMGFFSSEQSDENIHRYQKLNTKPTLIIAAENDEYTYQSAKKLFSLAKNSSSQFMLYKGNEHGYPLLNKDRWLAKKIAYWFNDNLTL